MVDEKKYKRHIKIWNFCFKYLQGIIKKIFSYDCEVAPEISSPYLVLSNHNVDLDPALIGFSFPKQMYFVASEHVYRVGIVSKILKWAFEPIAKIKGSSDTTAVMKVIRYLRNGKNVCLFPEGNRSFNGKTGEITEAIGKLVKASKATLVTYKTIGGYFTTPRWGYGIRKGKMFGKVVNIYDVEKLNLMTVEEITKVVAKDIFVDAYEEQKQNPIKYKGKKIAKSLEIALCVCPNCKKIDSLKTNAKEIFCMVCNLKTKINEYGFFDKDFVFETITEWDSFQEKYFENAIMQKEFHEDEIIFSDEDVCIKIIKKNHEEKILGVGKLFFKNEKIIFEFGNKKEKKETKYFPINEISDMSIYGKNVLVFTDNDGIHYEAKGKKMKNVRKYLYMHKYREN